MNYKPDLNLEYNYIRVVYEVILSDLRVNKKIIEKELNTVVARLQNLKKKKTDIKDNLKMIRSLIQKVNDLQGKFNEITKKEELLYNCLKDRIKQLEMIDDNHYSFSNLKLFCEKKINNLLLDFFLREKFLETARHYIEDEKITNSVEYSIFQEIQNIISSLKNHDLSDALKWANANKNKLTKINSNFKQKIICQMFIEKYKKGELLECVAFARENFKEFPNNINEISKIMIFLAIKPQQISSIPKYQAYLEDERWVDLENAFKSVFFQVYSIKSHSLLEILFQTGLMSMKSSFCYTNKKCMNCPVCCDDLGELAKSLPSSNHPVSSLICRITGEIMDSSNPPLALPNGQVYSEKAINEQIRANGKFVCPITNQEYKLDKCKKVFIS